jgi:phosphoglycerate dehydrogenase-like enzyme
LTIRPFLLPDGEIADGVRELLPDVPFSTYIEAQRAAGDLAAVEFYVPPYLATDASLEMLRCLPNVRVVQALTAGVDWIASSMPAGAVLCNARGVHEASTSELALAGILALVKRIPEFVRLQDAATWGHQRVHGLASSRAVILGYGAIGKAIGRRLEAFEVDVVGVTSSGRDQTMPLSAMDHALGTCEILVITLPLTASTLGLVDAGMLSKLPDGAIVVNVGRGPTVDQTALEAELVSGRLRAVLDVTDPEPLPTGSALWRLKNVLVTPHVGGDSDLFPRLACWLVAGQIRRHLAGDALEHQVTGRA